MKKTKRGPSFMKYRVITGGAIDNASRLSFNYPA